MKRVNEKALFLLPAVAMLVCFVMAISIVNDGRQEEGKRQLEDVLRRTAVACYAAEGFYPPNIEYMQQHYGLRYDEKQYAVFYEIFASNLMPDITVLEKQSK